MRHWFRLDRAWVERREAILRAEEDRIIREARDRATGEERAFIDGLLEERERSSVPVFDGE
jgi:hypothetical protein